MSEIRRALAAELRAARSMAGISGRGMAKQLGITQGTIWRIDNGETLPRLDQAERWLDACNVHGDQRDRILDLLGEAHRDAPAWSRRLAGAEHLQRQAAEREQASRRVRNYQPTVIPGLLQTEQYARHVMQLADITGGTDLAAALAARLDRQAILHEDARRFAFVLDEAVLSWWPAPDVAAGQLDRLIALAELDTIDIAVVPRSAAVATPWHNFVIHDPADETPPYVTVETVHDGIEVRDRKDVALYVTLWDRLWKAAATGDEALELIRRAA